MTTFVAVIVLRVSVMLVFAAAATAAMRRSSAAARHLVWSCALVGSLMVPAISTVVPSWEIPLLPAVETRAPQVSSVPSGPVPPAQMHRLPGTVSRPETAAVISKPSPSAVSVTPARTPWPGVLWLLGFAMVVARLALGTIRMKWIARHATRVGSGRWMRLAARLAGALGVARRVVFLEGNHAAMPMTWGVFTSRVLLPRAAEGWPSDRQRVVLLHELAHVKRRDCLTQLVAQLACAVYWFNPLVWFACARLRAEREHACDDLVLASGTRGSDYADHLLDIARSMRSTMMPTWAAVAMAHRSQLEGRLMAILDPHVSRRAPTGGRSFALIACIMGLLVPIAGMTPAPRAAEAVISSGIDQSPTQPVAAPEPSVSPAPLSSPAKRPDPASSPVASILGEALSDAVPDAMRDLVRETILGSIVGGTAESVGLAVTQAVGEGVSGGVGRGVGGGVKGGIKGGVAGGVRGAVKQEIEKEVESDRKGARDPRVVQALVAALNDTDKDVRESAMQALMNMRAPEALDAIRGSLKDTNPSVREQAAFALGQYRDKASVDALASLLQDSSADVREQAVFALGQIREPRAIPALTAALKDSDADVREQAAFALGQLRSSEAVEPLGVALRDQSADVREQAAFALGQIRDRGSVDPLLVALKDANASVREQAAFALGQLRDPRAIDGLTAALKDPVADVRQHAAFALGQIGK